MNLFKKLFSKKKKKESWYNNSHEEKTPRWTDTPEGAAFGQSGNQHDNMLVKNMTKKGKF